MNKFLLHFLTALPILIHGGAALATLNEVDKTQIYNKNLLVNGGFESGKALWTASAGTFATTTTSPLIGLVHATWDASASTQTLTTTAVVIPVGMRGRNSVVSCLILNASGTATHSLQAYDGTNALASRAVLSSPTASRNVLNFIMPSSGSISLRLVANADEPSISIDDCYIGPAEGYNMGLVENSKESWSGYHDNTCSFARTNTSYGDPTADTTCGFTQRTNTGFGTVTSYLSGSDKLPGFVFTPLGNGTYFICARAGIIGSGTTPNMGLKLWDGTTTIAETEDYTNSTSLPAPLMACGYLVVTTGTTAKTISLQTKASTGSITLTATAAASTVEWSIQKTSSSTSASFTPDLVPNSWNGYHDSTCNWSRTNTVIGDVTDDSVCALVQTSNTNFGTVSTSGSVSPAITFTPKRIQKYQVCATFTLTASASPGNTGVVGRLTDGTTVIADSEHKIYNGGAITAGYSMTLCGHYTPPSLSPVTLKLQAASTAGSIQMGSMGGVARSSIEWSIVGIDQSFPSPLIVNSVVSPNGGVTGICSGLVTITAGTPAVTRSDGNCFGTLIDNATGDTTVPFAAGTFSSAPNCVCSAYDGGGISCEIEDDTPTSASTTRVQTVGGTGSAADANFFLICIGPK